MGRVAPVTARRRHSKRRESRDTPAVTVAREAKEPRAAFPDHAPGRTVLPERNLDVLRAVAVMLVVGSHLVGLWTATIGPLTVGTFGLMGVLLFFVHTSLVLMSSLERLQTSVASPGRLCLAFYVRRAFRIYPLAMACILAYVVFRVPPGTPLAGEHIQYVAPTLPQLLANLGLVQDLFATRYVIGVLWSLPVEVQMYLLLPLCYFAAKRGSGYVIGLFALAVVAWLGLVHVRGAWRLSVLAFGPCFVAGVMAYAVLRTRRVRKLPGWTWPLLLTACAPLFLMLDTASHPPERGWLFCVAVGACIPFVRELDRSWLTRLASVVATYSYGIYLTHVAAICVAFVWLGGMPLAARWLAFTVLFVGLPFVAYHAIERPMIALGIRISGRFRDRGSAMTTAAAVAPAP